MRVDPSFNGIKHQFDPWHVAKGVCKSLNKTSVKKKTGASCCNGYRQSSTISGGALVLVIRTTSTL